MKYFLLFATLLCLTGIACKKSKKPGPMDVLPGNWELKNASARSEPATATFRFAADRSFTRTVGATVQNGIFVAHYISDNHNVIEVILKEGQNQIGVFTLEMVSAYEFRYGFMSAGPGPSISYVLLRIK